MNNSSIYLMPWFTCVYVGHHQILEKSRTWHQSRQNILKYKSKCWVELSCFYLAIINIQQEKTQISARTPGHWRQWRCQPKNLWGDKMFDFRRI